MCSRNDAEDGTSDLMEVAKPMWTTECQKCSKEKPVIQILQIKHAYCRDCFLTHVTHKFRSTLGKSKMMKKTDVVMAAISGSLKSHVMLHLLHAGLSENSHKRFHFKVQVLYIDEGAVLGISYAQRLANLKSLLELVEHYGFRIYFTSLAHVFIPEGPICFPLHADCNLEIQEKLENDLQQLFNSVSSTTSKEDLLKQLRKQLLLKSAKELNCGKIFTASTSTDMATQILTDVSLGRGSLMHRDVTFLDDGDKHVKIMRPLLEFSSKEASFYAVYNKLSSVFIPSLCTKEPSCQSIHNLSQKFVMELMENFPSTVSTIFRTGEKLGVSSTAQSSCTEEDNFCVLCQVPLETKVSACSSVQATEFSRTISSLGPLGFDDKTLSVACSRLKMKDHMSCSKDSKSNCMETDIAQNSKEHSLGLSLNDVKEYFCYGCHLILLDMKSIFDLPKNVLELIQKRRRLQSMRESIQDFFL